MPDTGSPAVHHIVSGTYDFNTGSLSSSTDQNSKTSNYTYEPLGRISTASFPDSGQTNFIYTDTPLSAHVERTQKITSSLTKDSFVYFDGLARQKQTQLVSDPGGTTYVDTTYDALGRVKTVSNPHRSASSATDGITTYVYDILNRICVVVPPDGTAVSGNNCPATQPSNDAFTGYSGNTATVTDQAGKSRQSISDGLGRLTQVFEDPAGLNYETDYTYDALGNLLTVNQKGGTTDTTKWRTRTFTYNSLAQLLTASNPESGTITYAYDNAGNLQTKTAPKPNQTGSLTVVSTYSYDAVNRLIQKSFNDGSTPTVKYGYDAVALTGCTTAPPTLTITNGIGLRTAMCDAAGAEAWSYDTLGRTLTEKRITNAVTKSAGYTYNLDGSVAALTNPSGRTITYILQFSGTNTAGRMLSAVDTANSINYATAASYGPTGALSSLTNGASLIQTNYYNSRLQPCRISIKSSGTAPTQCTDAANVGGVLDFTYNFNLGSSDNGNVIGITNNRSGASGRSQLFTYDALNRIFTAKTTSTSGTSCWDEQFGYDPWANLLTIGRISGYTCSNEELLNLTATPKNQISGYTYDAAGNLINDGLGHSYTFNAENQLTCAASTAYLYDGDGKRVEKATGCATPAASKLYWYGIGSDPLTETDSVGTPSAEYVFFLGRRNARIDLPSAVVHYYFSDHLGSANVVTSSAGAIQDESDYYPFGGERAITNSDPNNFKFTGKERDSESGLDNFGARFNSSNLGRFMSPDPDNIGSRLGAPQSWNAYSYTLDNPLKYIDPSGLDCIYFNDDDNHKGWIKAGDCESETDNGYYVDGTINGAVYDRQTDLTNAGISFDQDNNWATYTFKPYDASFANNVGGQCIGDCPNQAILVSAPLLPRIPAPWEEGQKFNSKYSYIFGPALVISAYTGLDPSFCGPSAETGAPEDSDHPKKQTQADEDLNNGKLVKDSRPKRPGPAPKYNPDGTQSSETTSALGEAVSLANNGARCLANNRSQPH
jgi:RHS repeat-associated protein